MSFVHIFFTRSAKRGKSRVKALLRCSHRRFRQVSSCSFSLFGHPLPANARVPPHQGSRAEKRQMTIAKISAGIGRVDVLVNLRDCHLFIKNGHRSFSPSSPLPRLTSSHPPIFVSDHLANAQWGRTAKNWDVGTGPLARPFARSLAPLPRSWESEFLMSQNDLVLYHSALSRIKFKRKSGKSEEKNKLTAC